MTYCVGLTLDGGIVFASDTRTNAGVDNVAVYSKMTVWEFKGDRVLVLMTAGNLAFTQSIVSSLNEKIAAGTESSSPSLLSVSTLFQAARAVGETIREYRRTHQEMLAESPMLADGTFILGGQIKGEQPRLFQIYKEGNFIETSKDTPYFQIGEHKYGKPILDRVTKLDMRLGVAAKLLLISFDSTIRSNLSVGMPIDLLIYRRDSFDANDKRRIEDKDPYYLKISAGWSQAIRDAFEHIDEYGDDALDLARGTLAVAEPAAGLAQATAGWLDRDG